MRGGRKAGLPSPAAAAGRAQGEASHKGPLSRRRPAPRGWPASPPPFPLSPTQSRSPLLLPCPGQAAPRDEAGLRVPCPLASPAPRLGESQSATGQRLQTDAGPKEHHHGNALLGLDHRILLGFLPAQPRVGVGAPSDPQVSSLVQCLIAQSQAGLGQEGGADPPLGRILSGPLCRDARFHLTPNQNANLNWNSGPWAMQKTWGVFSTLNFILIDSACPVGGLE